MNIGEKRNENEERDIRLGDSTKRLRRSLVGKRLYPTITKKTLQNQSTEREDPEGNGDRAKERTGKIVEGEIIVAYVTGPTVPQRRLLSLDRFAALYHE